MNVPGYRTEAKQAERLGKTPRTLAAWRKRGIGPRWVRNGKTILYPEDGDIVWLKANEQQPVRERHRHTSRQRQGAPA
jgi:hypothetical protein